MKSLKALLLMSVAGVAVLAAGCNSTLKPEPFDANHRLTAGQVKMNVQTGKTTQNEIFQALGAPNVVALENGKGEIWTYDQIRVRKTAQGYGAGAFFATLFGMGDSVRRSPTWDVGHGVGEAGLSVNSGFGTSTTSVLTATLIIRFDANEKVSSYKMLVTSF